MLKGVWRGQTERGYIDLDEKKVAHRVDPVEGMNVEENVEGTN